MIMNIILALIFGFSRAAHGGGYVSRLLSILFMACGYAGYLLLDGRTLIDSAVMGLIAFAGLFGGLVLGWGKGFAAITGRYFKDEKEFFPADWAGDYAFAASGNPKFAGAVFMTVRGMLFYPLFIALAAYTGLWLPYLLSGLAVLSMGLVYWLAGLCGETRAVRIAEVAYLAIIGYAVG